MQFLLFKTLKQKYKSKDIQKKKIIEKIKEL